MKLETSEPMVGGGPRNPSSPSSQQDTTIDATSATRLRSAPSGGLDATGLAEHLQTLGNSTASVFARERSARAVLSFGRALARWLFARHFSMRGAMLGECDRQDLITESVQRLGEVASIGASPFHGQSDGEAFKWCRIVLLRKIQAELQRRLRENAGNAKSVAHTFWAAGSNHLEPFESPPEEPRIDVSGLLLTVHDEILRSCASRYATDLADAAFEWFATILGRAAVAEIQLSLGLSTCATDGSDGIRGRSPPARRKRRQRGKEAAKAAIATLYERGELANRALFAARMFGLLDDQG